jgi:hypothetical protein
MRTETRSENWNIKQAQERRDDAIYNTFNGDLLIFSYEEIKLMDGGTGGDENGRSEKSSRRRIDKCDDPS